MSTILPKNNHSTRMLTYLIYFACLQLLLGRMLELEARIAEAELQVQALLKVLKKIDKRLLQEAGIHLHIQDDIESLLN